VAEIINKISNFWPKIFNLVYFNLYQNHSGTLIVKDGHSLCIFTKSLKKQQFLTNFFLELFWPTPSTFVVFPHDPQWEKWLIWQAHKGAWVARVSEALCKFC
jgi:hypothetical protein